MESGQEAASMPTTAWTVARASLEPFGELSQIPEGLRSGVDAALPRPAPPRRAAPRPCLAVSPWSWPAARPAQPAAPGRAPGSQRPGGGWVGVGWGVEVMSRTYWLITQPTGRGSNQSTSLPRPLLATCGSACRGGRGRTCSMRCSRITASTLHPGSEPGTGSGSAAEAVHPGGPGAAAGRQPAARTPLLPSGLVHPRAAEAPPHRMRALPCLPCRISSATSFLRPFICSGAVHVAEAARRARSSRRG